MDSSDEQTVNMLVHSASESAKCLYGFVMGESGETRLCAWP